jgi:hypothetical protein
VPASSLSLILRSGLLLTCPLTSTLFLASPLLLCATDTHKASGQAELALKYYQESMDLQRRLLGDRPDPVLAETLSTTAAMYVRVSVGVHFD